MSSAKTKIYIAGHQGMVGSACWRLFQREGYTNLIGKTSKELDLRNQWEVAQFIKKEKPEIIIDAAAIVGGIWANNQYPYKFLIDNMLIQNNLIHASINHRIENFIFLGSSCIYPKLAAQPLKEEYLLTGELEKTNQWYAIAKICGVKLIESVRKEFGFNYLALMPTNLYGPNDNFDPMTSHVLPGMIAKFHQAKVEKLNEVVLWGDGSPLREFMHVDDLANAILFSVQNKLDGHLYNVGSDDEISIKRLSLLVKKIVGFEGAVTWDTNYPNGTPRKKLDSSKLLEKGWKPNIALEEGIIQTHKFYLEKYSNA
jgi:GDP-L-fucose synthase